MKENGVQEFYFSYSYEEDYENELSLYNLINSSNGRSMIHEIICKSDKTSFDKLFFEKRCQYQDSLNFNTLDFFDNSPLMDAIIIEDSNEMAMILIANFKHNRSRHRKITVNPFFQNSLGLNALKVAVRYNRLNVIKAILKHLPRESVFDLLFLEAITFKMSDVIQLLFSAKVKLSFTESMKLFPHSKTYYDSQFSLFLLKRNKCLYINYHFSKYFPSFNTKLIPKLYDGDGGGDGDEENVRIPNSQRRKKALKTKSKSEIIVPLNYDS